MKFFSSVLCATPAVPTQSSFQAANQHIFGWKNPFASPPKDCPLLHVDFLSRYDEITAFTANSDAMKFSKSVWGCLKQETNLMQARLANQHQVIMPSWLPKVPSWLRKNALCLSQSAFSNFAPYVIKWEITKFVTVLLHSNWSNLRRKCWRKIWTDMNVLSCGPKASNISGISQRFMCKAQHVRACVAGDVAICSEKRKIVPYHGDNPNTRNGARLRSPSPIMAPDLTHCPHTVIFLSLIYVLNYMICIMWTGW